MPDIQALPSLYKKTSNGAIQVWEIWTKDNVIVTHYGLFGGKFQVTEDVIHQGKNLGKANETTAEQQAQTEARAKWEKQLKKGYVKTREEAQAGSVDSVIEGGIAPMLAHRFDEQAHKITYPAFAQPKFDGHRCIAVIKDGRATLWSRTRKPITGLPHIVDALERWADRTGNSTVTIDGELYNHDYKDNFEDLTSFIRNPEPKAGHEVVQYHMYDIVSDDTFVDRHAKLNAFSFIAPCLVPVETVSVADEDELMEVFEGFLKLGYEGLMVRNAAGKYVNKRSYDLQKVKEFHDAEYEVVGVEAGRGKMSDKAIFVCKTEAGTEFRAKMKGPLDSLRQYVDDPSLAIGKQLTVQYFGISNANQVPRFPVGLRFREDP